MDFLDPKRKKAHRRRLLIGYVLMAIAVSMGTLVLLFMAYGFDIDRKTGDVIQNGIIYVDSKPNGANIAINGQMQKARTSSGTRLALPTGQYTFDLTLDGYRPWSRSLVLEGGWLEQMVYPFLIPNEMKPADMQLYASAPNFGTASPDRHWLLVQQVGQTYVFDMYDLSNPASIPTTLTLPRSVLSEPDKPAALTVVDWSNDNRHVLLDRTYDNKHEFIIFDRENPTESYSLNTMFGVVPATVQIKNKRSDQFYILDGSGVLRSADAKSKVLSAPLLTNVKSFDSYNDDLLLYVTAAPGNSEKVEFRIAQDGRNYLLRSSPTSSKYMLSIAEYDNNWYYIVGSSNGDNVFVYKDPLELLKGRTAEMLNVATILHIEDPQFVNVSANSRFISLQSKSSVVTYDAYDDRQYKFTTKNQVPDGQEMKWMDGHRLTFNKDGFVYFIDFDGSNEQKIIAANSPLSGPFFDRDYDRIFTLAPSVTVSSRTALTQASFEIKK